MEKQRDLSPAASLSAEVREDLYRRILLIRLFEERVLDLFGEGRLAGTTHTCVGQEAVAVAAVANLSADDIIFSSHRCHGHFLARFDDPVPLLAELMGREGGACRGRGGSQNLCRDGFYSSGVQGGYTPIVTGMALAEKLRGTGRLVAAFIGDGTFGEGTLYESLNMASLWRVPLLFVVENNRYAQTTPISVNMAGTIVARAEAFGILSAEIESNDVARLLPFFEAAAGQARGGGGPMVAVVHTYRLRAHSKGDDDRPPEEIDAWRAEDPLIHAARGMAPETLRGIEARVRKRLEAAEREVEAMPPARMQASGGPGRGSAR
jgi:TPP-dependent pyruvate/acetoin dehydrogenase alpha subunit